MSSKIFGRLKLSAALNLLNKEQKIIRTIPCLRRLLIKFGMFESSRGSSSREHLSPVVGSGMCCSDTIQTSQKPYKLG